MSDPARMPASYDEDLSREPEHQHNRCDEHGRCLDCEGCDPCETENQIAANTEHSVRMLASMLSDAERALFNAAHWLGKLTGDLYDIELAESTAGDDVKHEIEAAQRHLRNVQRIADWRLKMLEV